MWKKIYAFQRWVTRNRLIAWWSVFLPALILLVLLSQKDLNVTKEVIENTDLSFQYKVLNFPSFVVLARVTMIAGCTVVLMICLLLPVFRISKTGVQWSKEMEEELTKASSEVTAEEVGLLIREETVRWYQVLRWLEIDGWQRENLSSLLRDLLFTLWETFPEHYISLTLYKEGATLIISDPLLPWLIKEEKENEERTIGFRISFSTNSYLLLLVYPRYEEGFSPIDENYLMILGNIFSRIIENKGISLKQLLAFFQARSLTKGE